MEKTLAEIARLVDGEVIGDENIVVTGISGIKEAKKGDLTFVANPKYFPLIDDSKASAVITPRDISTVNKTIIKTDNPSIAFADMADLFCDEAAHHITGIDERAVIADDAVIGKNVSIGPYAIIESKAVIGDNSVIYGGCFIGHQTRIGKNCLFYPNITVRERISIGNNVIVHSGTVLGSDGFGFVDVEGVQKKIPQIGTVVIEDDVEIGACVTIDRARFDRTFIGRGTKIDNLVQIAHNVIIEENCIIISQVGISGSCTIKKGAILAGQAGLAGHLTVGEGATVAAQAGVTKSVPPNTIVSGYPAKQHDQAIKINACVQTLPQQVKTVRELKKRIEELEAKIAKLEKK